MKGDFSLKNSLNLEEFKDLSKPEKYQIKNFFDNEKYQK